MARTPTKSSTRKKPAAAKKAPAKRAKKPAGPKVTVAQTGKVKEVAFTEGMTVKQALSAAGISTGGRGQQVRINNQACSDLDTTLAANDQVLVVGNIRGA